MDPIRRMRKCGDSKTLDTTTSVYAPPHQQYNVLELPPQLLTSLTNVPPGTRSLAILIGLPKMTSLQCMSWSSLIVADAETVHRAVPCTVQTDRNSQEEDVRHY